MSINIIICLWLVTINADWGLMRGLHKLFWCDTPRENCFLWVESAIMMRGETGIEDINSALVCLTDFMWLGQYFVYFSWFDGLLLAFKCQW